MIPRHANQLLSHLEEVADVGCSVVRRSVLVHWYGQERLTVSIWRDIQEKWQEVLELARKIPDKRTPLLAGEGDGTVTFVWGEGLTVAKSAWLKNVSELCGSKISKYVD